MEPRDKDEDRRRAMTPEELLAARVRLAGKRWARLAPRPRRRVRA